MVNELKTIRWKQKEVHDIVVECAQLSLDPAEGDVSDRSIQKEWTSPLGSTRTRPVLRLGQDKTGLLGR